MGDSFFRIEMINEFFHKIDEACDNIDVALRSEGCTYRTSYGIRDTRGLAVNFEFRGEVDYILLIPWEYVEDVDKIRDYYRRFKVEADKARVIPEIDKIAADFEMQEMKMLRNKQCLAQPLPK